MVGRLNLHRVCDGELADMNEKAERVLDSPDSGLPPSPSMSPSPWLNGERSRECEEERRASPSSSSSSPSSSAAAVSQKPVKWVPQLHPFSYGEGIELDPLPPKEIRYTSSVRYESARHFIQDVSLEPTGLGLELCSQTIMALSESTWRRFKTQLEFQPRQRVQRCQTTTIVYPKHTRTLYTTQLSYDGRKLGKRFVSSVELEVSDCRDIQC